MSKKEKPNRLAIGIVAAVLILLLASCLLLLFSGRKKAQYATVKLDGVLVKSIDLSTVSEPYTMSLTGKSGITNTIEVRHGEIGVITADCPDKVCVKRGFCSTSAAPIVCLPNKLEITLTNDPESTEFIPDAIVS